MASRLTKYVFAPIARNSFRQRGQFARASRNVSSNASHAQFKSSDKAWIFGSLVVFGPALVYLISPASRKAASHEPYDSHVEHLTEVQEPAKHVKGTEAPADVGSVPDDVSLADVPKVAQLALREPIAPSPETDDKSTESSSENSNTPNSEDQNNKHANSQSGTAPDAETDVEQKEEPTSHKSETFQGEGDSSPIIAGDVRGVTKEGTLPKKVEEISS